MLHRDEMRDGVATSLSAQVECRCLIFFPSAIFRGVYGLLPFVTRIPLGDWPGKQGQQRPVNIENEGTSHDVIENKG